MKDCNFRLLVGDAKHAVILIAHPRLLHVFAQSLKSVKQPNATRYDGKFYMFLHGTQYSLQKLL